VKCPVIGSHAQSRADKVIEMWRITALVLFFVPVCGAISSCPNGFKREVEIGGDSINGFVSLGGKPVKSALLNLYSSSGKSVRTAMTDANGRFTMRKISPGKYSLHVQHWGERYSIEVNPTKDRERPFKGDWWLTLMDGGCAGVGWSVDALMTNPHSAH